MERGEGSVENLVTGEENVGDRFHTEEASLIFETNDRVKGVSDFKVRAVAFSDRELEGFERQDCGVFCWAQIGEHNGSHDFVLVIGLMVKVNVGDTNGERALCEERSLRVIGGDGVFSEDRLTGGGVDDGSLRGFSAFTASEEEFTEEETSVLLASGSMASVVVSVKRSRDLGVVGGVQGVALASFAESGEDHSIADGLQEQ
jgi:hypothetical protein